MNNIRLNKECKETILCLAKDYFDTEDVWIFGSRVDMNKKGGDIDIFIKTIDSFIYRLTKIQDKMGDKFFPAVLLQL